MMLVLVIVLLAQVFTVLVVFSVAAEIRERLSQVIVALSSLDEADADDRDQTIARLVADSVVRRLTTPTQTDY